MLRLIGGVPFVELGADAAGAVDPGVFVFPQEAVAPFNVAFEKAVAADGKEHVARACGAKVTAGAVDGADDVLVKENGVLGSSAE